MKLCVKLLGNNEEAKELLMCINRAETYLKARFKTHCTWDDSCVSHCIKHALSNPKDAELLSKCDELHDLVCGECLNVVDSIKSLKLKLTHLPSCPNPCRHQLCHEKQVAVYEVDNSEAKVIEWQRHILRGAQQSKARSDAFANLGPTNSLWIRDYAQKYNPTKTLEAMNEYFGKRGMTISVEVFITKSFMSYQKQVYLVALDRCYQGTLETLCIADTVLEQFSVDNPHIKQIGLKTDNAGNYHANGVPECMFKIGQKRGIAISDYNYNEAQLGKDQCDRESAIFKTCAERWLLKKEIHKITTAKELVEAVFSDGGPKNTKMCVLKIDKKVAKLEGVRNIANISYYHSVKFQENGAVYREYYNIGNGKFHDFSEIKFVNGSSRVFDWMSSRRQEDTMTYDSRNKHRSFACPETLCVLEFTNENDMLSHIASASHQYAKTKNGMDKAVLYYAQQKQVQNASIAAAIPKFADADERSKSYYTQIYIQGWARKVRRIRKITIKQREFIEKCFKNGAASSAKLSAEQMAQEMKNMIVNGHYYFRPDEYLECSQIRGLISRLKKKENDSVKKLAISEDAGIEANICDSVLNSDNEDIE